MLHNVSYNNPEIKKVIDHELGQPYSFLARIKMGGIGSPRLPIIKACDEINELLVLDNNRNVCNIELRPKGIIVGFRSLLESYAFTIPFYKLSVYKGDSQKYTLYRDQHFVQVLANERSAHVFLKRIISQKAAYLTSTL